MKYRFTTPSAFQHNHWAVRAALRGFSSKLPLCAWKEWAQLPLSGSWDVWAWEVFQSSIKLLKTSNFVLVREAAAWEQLGLWTEGLPAGTLAERDAMINSHLQQHIAARRGGSLETAQHCEAMFLFTTSSKIILRTHAGAPLSPDSCYIWPTSDGIQQWHEHTPLQSHFHPLWWQWCWALSWVQWKKLKVH